MTAFDNSWAQTLISPVVVPSLTRIMGTERYTFLCCTHIKTSRGYKVASSLALYPDSGKSWVQRGIFSHPVPSLEQVVGTERYIFLRCTHIKTSHGYREASFSRCALIRTSRGYKAASSLALYPHSGKSWVQRGIFSRPVPSLEQVEGTKRHLLLLCTLIRTSHGYKTVPSLSLCPF